MVLQTEAGIISDEIYYSGFSTFPHWLGFFKRYDSQNVWKSINIEAYRCFQANDKIIDSMGFYFAIMLIDNYLN